MGSKSLLAAGLLLAAAVTPASGQDIAAPDSVDRETAVVGSPDLTVDPETAAVDSLDLTVEEPAIEFRTNVPWARMVLAGKQSIAGRSPLRVPGPLIGNYWLEASGTGLERQRGRVRFALNEEGSRVYSFGAIPFRQNFTRSIVFPGYSQYSFGQTVKGVGMAGLAAGGIGLAIWANGDMNSARDAMGTLADRLDVTSDPDTAAVTREMLYDASAEAKHLEKRRDLMIKATGTVWAIGMIDALLFTPRFDARDVDEGSVTLTLRTGTRARAMIRSLVFPGLGQEYNGDHKKAFLAGTGGVLAASYLLWRQDEVYREEAGLEQAEARLASNPTAESTAQRDGRLRDLDDARGVRDWALRIAVGYWALSLLDTALTFNEPWGEVPVAPSEDSAPATVGWAVDPLRGALAARVRF
ncbi:MAG TPA: DUF5683 domain-containing protein [bacterium]|nr:DUF5683 domain-containing protein [bacterium]